MNPPVQQNRRRIRWVDHVLQKSLLVALVIMETVVVSIAIWLLYQSLGEIIDENMYRIHFSANVDMLSMMIREGLRVLGGMLLVNVMALIIADRIWALYVDGILFHLDSLMLASSQLDFSEQPPISLNHTVLEQALAWRASEAEHLGKFRDRLRNLPLTLPALPQERETVALALATLQDD